MPSTVNAKSSLSINFLSIRIRISVTSHIRIGTCQTCQLVSLVSQIGAIVKEEYCITCCNIGCVISLRIPINQTIVEIISTISLANNLLSFLPSFLFSLQLSNSIRVISSSQAISSLQLIRSRHVIPSLQVIFISQLIDFA
jgi:hypothetical protein